MAFFRDSLLFLLMTLQVLPFSNQLRIRKCCDSGQVLDAETLTCIANPVERDRMTNFKPSYVIDPQLNLMTMQLTEENFAYDSMLSSCSHYELLDLTKPLEYLIATNGRLISLAGKYSTELNLGDFCIETAYLKSRLTFRAAVICNPCINKKCLQNCCSHLQMAVIDTENTGQIRCQNPPDFNAGIRVPKVPKFLENWNLVKSDMQRYDACEAKNGTIVISHDFDISEDGASVSSGLNQSEDFCLAFTATDGESWTGSSVELCVTDEQAMQIALFTKTYPICCSISNVFLLLTFLVYARVPSLRSPLFGKMMMIFIFCLFLAYTSISIVSFGHSQLVNDRPPHLDYSPICRVLGFVLQFTYLQAFFWMNVLSFDIYKAFGSEIKLTSVTRKEQDDIRKLLFYTMYASGVPLIIIILSVVVEYQPRTYSGPRPELGVHQCFFGNDLGSFIFFHLPLLIIQTTNLVFFVLTTNKLFETWRLTKVESNSDYRITPRAQRNSSNFKVVLKIFVIMGVTWFSELFGFILSWIYGRNKVWKFFVLNDVINLLQGVFIFIVLVCKSSVFSQLGLNKNREKKKISINAVTKETSLN